MNGETPKLKLALSIEGGGMRSVISAGMAYALEQNGIGPQYFDAVFGASGGSFNAAYYITGQAEDAMKGYWENTGKDLIDFWRIGRRQYPINMNHMLEEMVHSKPLDFEKVLVAKKLRPLATSIATGEAVAFEPAKTQQELLLQLKAGSVVPILVGKPVTVNGEDYLDAGIAERIPFKTPISLDYDGVLILSTQPLITTADKTRTRVAKNFLRYGIGKLSRELAALVLENPQQKTDNSSKLLQMTTAPTEPPYALAISPILANAKLIGNTNLHVETIKSAAQIGYDSAKEVIDLITPARP
jgi:predicted patatin/cPLA2 family phospholipase